MCARAAREEKSGYFRAAQGLNHLAGVSSVSSR